MASSTDSVLCNNMNLHQDDPDISGPGVLAAFILSSILTLLLSGITLWLQQLKHLKRENRVSRSLKRYSSHIKDPIGFWIEQLELFVLALSDQQLLTGLLLLVCAYGKYWDFSVRCGGNNMWNAVDVVCFSSLTHAATLLTLRSYFRRHRILAAVRVFFMYAIYGLLLVAIVQSLKPNPMINDRPKLPSSLAMFWQGTGYIEIIGIMILYLITYLPIFLSREAMKVRICLAMNAEQLPAALAAWKPAEREKDSWFRGYTCASWFNPYKVIRSFLTKFAVSFCKTYDPKRPWTCRLLWILSEILFPFWTTPLLLLILWLFGLGYMCMKIHQSNLTTNWSFGQLLPVFLVFLPFHTLIGSIADARQQGITNDGGVVPENNMNCSSTAPVLSKAENRPTCQSLSSNV